MKKKAQTLCKKIFNDVSFVSIFLIATTKVFAGDYGDIYGAHPAANAMGNAVLYSSGFLSSVLQRSWSWEDELWGLILWRSGEEKGI